MKLPKMKSRRAWHPDLWHAEKIARQTIQNPAWGLVSGPSVAEAKQTLQRMGYTDSEIATIETA